MWPGNLMENLKNNRVPPLYYVKLCASFQSHRWIQTGVTVRKRPIWVKIGPWVKMWRMTLKNDRAHLLSYFKLCASFHSHLSIQNGVTVHKHQNPVKIGDFCPLTFDGWPWKTIEHFINVISSFVYHIIAICENKMKLQPGNTKVGSKMFFLSRGTFKFHRWSWKTIGNFFYATSSLEQHS